jgi:membrane protease YdiL (CAAX protease family)
MSNAPEPPTDPTPAGPTPDGDSDGFEYSGSVVRAAIVFEGMIALGAYVLGDIVERPPGERIAWSLDDALWGLIAAAPMLLALIVLMRLPIAAIERLREFSREFLIPMFRGATWPQLILISALAGLGEEMLFRGLIQHGLMDAIGGTAGIVAGLALGSITFGLAHAATRTYAIVAGLVGLYLGGVFLMSGNLLVPIVAHAAYDIGAFVFLLRMQPAEESITKDAAN